MPRLILTACLFLCFYVLEAQQSKFGISLTPALVLSPDIRVGIQPGFEYRFNDRLSLLTEIAVAAGKSKSLSYRDNRYFRIKPELRYKLETIWGYGLYAGLQFSYSHRKWKDLYGGSYYDEKLYSDTVTTYTRADISSPIFTSSLQLGIIMPLGDLFNIDLFMGMGGRMIFTRYTNLENIHKEGSIRSFCRIFPSPDPARWINGNVTRFHCNFGIRALYRF